MQCKGDRVDPEQTASIGAVRSEYALSVPVLRIIMVGLKLLRILSLSSKFIVKFL